MVFDSVSLFGGYVTRLHTLESSHLPRKYVGLCSVALAQARRTRQPVAHGVPIFSDLTFRHGLPPGFVNPPGPKWFEMGLPTDFSTIPGADCMWSTGKRDLDPFQIGVAVPEHLDYETASKPLTSLVSMSMVLEFLPYQLGPEEIEKFVLPLWKARPLIAYVLFPIGAADPQAVSHASDLAVLFGAAWLESAGYA